MTLNKFLRGTALCGVFGVLLIPFIRLNSMFFPFITGKGFLFRVIVEIIFAAWLLLVFRDVASRPRKSYILWTLSAFMVVIGLADMFGVNPWKSFWSNFERMEGYISLIHLFLYFIVASSILSTEKLWRRFFEWSIWASGVMALYGMLQIHGDVLINQGGVRVDGTFGNATYLAIYMVFNIFFALVIAFRDKEELWKKITYSIIAFLDFIILYHTATRGSILGLLGGLLLSAFLIAVFDKGEKTRRIVAASIVGAVVIVVLGFIGIKHTQFVQASPVLSRFASISWADTQTQARAYIWPMAVEGWKEKPILGWGQENFNYIFNKNYDPRMYSQEQWFDHAHNTVLDWLVAGGVLGLLAYLLVFAAAVFLLWRRSTDVTFTEKALLTGLGAAYFFHNLFVFDNVMSYILFIAVLAYIHFRSTRLEKPLGVTAEEVNDSETRMAGPVILVVLIFCLYFFNWRGFATNIYLIDALQATSVSPVAAQAALDAYKKALSYDTLGRPEVIERIVESAPAMNGSDVPIDIREQFATMAKNAVDEELVRFPGDARYEMFAGNFYSAYGQVQDAEKHFVNAVNLSPRKQSILFQLGGLYIATKQYDKALDIFKRAYDLEHSDADAVRYYAMALVYNGQESDAAKLLQTTGAGTLTDDAIIRAYVELGEWSKAIAALKARVAADPTDMTNRKNLMSAYYQSGNKTAAIQVIRDMIGIDPTFKAQGEQYIQLIQSGK